VKFLLPLLLLLLPATAQAYTVYGGTWPETCFTWNSDDPEMMRDAIALWGQYAPITDCGPSDSPEIRASIAELSSAGAASLSGDGVIYTQCVIWIDPASQFNFGVWAHEFGHCLGIGHSEDDDALMAPYCCAPPSNDDIAAVRSLYGEVAPTIYRTWVPGIAREE